ncbi:hypothetical protein ACEQ8H_002004 [Pleosporales sp. CAS-2024a]
MATPVHKRRDHVSSEKRERDVFLLYGAAFRNIPRLAELGPDPENYSLPGHHVPQLSRDSTLTALAQLATFRLGASRAMISLIDDQRQYILAEATPNMSVHPQTTVDTRSTLWLGSGMCEKILDVDLAASEPNGNPTLVIRDLRQSAEHANRTYLKEKSVQFYAGAPLISPSGAIIGSVAVLDAAARPHGLSQEQRHSLWDIARSIMDHLHTYTIKDQLWRGERFTRGLISFSEGGEILRPFKNARQVDADKLTSYQVSPEALASPYDERGDPKEKHTARMNTRPELFRSKTGALQSMENLQDTILPLDAKSMFSRAATIMLASSDLDGVVILDASIAANKRKRRRSRSQESTSTGTGPPTEDAGDSYQSAPSSSDASSSSRAEDKKGSAIKYSQVLSSATRAQESGAPAYGSLSETDLSRMLQDYPNGEIITFDPDGLALSSTDESSTSSSNSRELSRAEKRRSSGDRSGKNCRALQTMLPGARSVAFVPFWDYERSRWFAGCLCWSNRPHRLLSSAVDLPYFKVFSHSVMREISRLDAVALNQSKTTFVASISHELRSPLHGILGTLEFIKDTQLDLFQTSMINSLNACGITLLDTINNVMDYADIGKTHKNISTMRFKNRHTLRLSSKTLKNRPSRAGAFDLGIATEEVIEAVFSGSTYVPVSRILLDAPLSPTNSETEMAISRKKVYIVLDISQADDWIYCFPVGSWRRIVMNVFGNAIKYTHSGHVHVSLRASDWSKVTGDPTTITLTIIDSGIGISSKFLADKAFQPFSQENSFASGTGLGLSIIRQIIETNGGRIEVHSEPSVGTKVTVKLALFRPEPLADTTLGNMQTQRGQFLAHLSRLRGRKICILRNRLTQSSLDQATLQILEGLSRFTDVLANTLEEQLCMDVVQTTEWVGHESDLVIVPELSFDYLSSIRSSRAPGGRAPVTIFVAMDALEAATLRSDWRVRNKESVVEILTQPCGSFKLAYILNLCLDRYDHPDENLEHHNPSKLVSSREKLSVMTMTHAMSSATIGDSSPTLESTNAPPLQRPPLVSAAQVLIVDDNSINRKILVAFMKRHCYSFQEATNGLEALEAYKSSETQFETVLMDMSMPIMDGMTSTRAIRQYENANKLARCRIIALTGLASASARLEALSSGVDHFVTKPTNFVALERLLERSSEKRRRYSESLISKEPWRKNSLDDVEVAESSRYNRELRQKAEVVAERDEFVELQPAQDLGTRGSDED